MLTSTRPGSRSVTRASSATCSSNMSQTRSEGDGNKNLPPVDFWSRSLGAALSAHLVHTYSATALRLKRPNSSEKPLDSKRLSRVVAFIDGSAERDFSVSDLASVACMSPAHFSRSFKAATGHAPHEYVSRQRLDLAKRLLVTSDRPLVEIAYATGFRLRPISIGPFARRREPRRACIARRTCSTKSIKQARFRLITENVGHLLCRFPSGRSRIGVHKVRAG